MHAATAASLCGVIDALGRTDFAGRALAALQPAIRAASWSVYELQPGCAPVMHLSSTHADAGPDRTAACFEAYAGGLYLRDSSFDRVRRQRAGGPMVTTMHADAAPNREHREAIYRAHQVLERLSVAAQDECGALLAVNLYHHEPQGPFTAAERERFQAMAPLLFQSVRRHLSLRHERSQTPSPRAAMLAAAPALTARELDVCERLLRGWTYDGVAADLGLTVPTVKTYRARAFARLGLHFRSELFARFGQAQALRH
jgi:DNA-binding CsgD family transcriptional regulator